MSISRFQGSIMLHPWLICLNLQREYATPGRPLYAPNSRDVAEEARRCLRHARASDWRVAHVRTRRARLANSKLFSQPIDGLEPLPSEPVFATAYRSALTHADLRAQLIQSPPHCVYVVGFSLAQDGLATLFHGLDLDLPMHVVEGATGSPNLGDRSAADVDRTALAVAASMSGMVTVDEVLGAAPAMLLRFGGRRDER